MAGKRFRIALYWLGGGLLCLALGAASVARWMQMAGEAREELIRHQREGMEWDRKRLADFWGEKASWFPDAAAEPALAVLPRAKFSEFDAIYVLYRGQQGRAVLGLTQVGGYYNLEPILVRSYPETMIARKLAAGEMDDLHALIDLLQKRLATLDPQLNQGGWNRHVVEVAQDLERRQKGAGAAMQGAAPTPAAPNPSPGAKVE